METNISDEFQVLKDELKKLNIEVLRIVKVGNGNMDFHEVFYKSPRYEEVKTVYLHIEKMDELIERFKEGYS
ncbi:hypothetical protein MTP09_12740 [Chryseobacterium suipulveris]|uniref:Legionella secretion system protein D n=1 Tax=Chryseobacterium suipulveris TaxID=2929800 RepID=A0ABY4BNK8_9FLAO|nr:hypothetical protein [Chryseobacterium suipulveris]UOE40758.1 hypothetical protein MTP09_12740 [Chryseobacterium suipulveris]